MTLNQLASAIAKREGKKSQARIGDIREILKIVVEMEAEDFDAGVVESLREAAIVKAAKKASRKK